MEQAAQKKTTKPLSPRKGRAGRVFYMLFKIVCGFLAALFGLITLVALVLMITSTAADRSARVLPKWERADLTEVLTKESWTDEDYDFLYHQTGLTRIALDAVDRSQLPAFQEALFFRGEVRHEYASSSTAHDYLVDPSTGHRYLAPIAPLEDGDVLVSSTCHTFGWRNGHSALVVNGQYGDVLESVSAGTNSVITRAGAEWFQNASNFILLRFKDAPQETRAAIAADAKTKLLDVPYSILTGFFSSPKDQFKDGRSIGTTHCSHLVWQAYKNFGYDIDYDGGPVCTSRDIAKSPHFEIVQVYGFDLDKVW